MKNKIIELGGKVWEKGDIKRVYFNCAIFNELLKINNQGQVNLSDSNNKFFYCETQNAVMRSYKSKKPTVEIQY